MTSVPFVEITRTSRQRQGDPEILQTFTTLLSNKTVVITAQSGAIYQKQPKASAEVEMQRELNWIITQYQKTYKTLRDPYKKDNTNKKDKRTRKVTIKIRLQERHICKCDITRFGRDFSPGSHTSEVEYSTDHFRKTSRKGIVSDKNRCNPAWRIFLLNLWQVSQWKYFFRKPIFGETVVMLFNFASRHLARLSLCNDCVSQSRCFSLLYPKAVFRQKNLLALHNNDFNPYIKMIYFWVTIDYDYRQSVTSVVCYEFRRLHMWAQTFKPACLLDTGDISKTLKEIQTK